MVLKTGAFRHRRNGRPQPGNLTRSGRGIAVDVLVFDLKGSVGHFRRPDTTATHATYPFITRTALRGILGALLGMEEFVQEDARAGIRLMTPVQKSVQRLSMLGKGFLGGGPDFNRPTSIELLVNPYYRIYYSGPYLDELARTIEERRSVYHTYLGSAFALTVPEWVGVMPGTLRTVDPELELVTATVVPMHVVGRLMVDGGSQLSRAGGVLYNYLGERRFRGTINLLYDMNGGTIRFRPAPGPYSPDAVFVDLPGEGTVCLW